MGAVYLAKIFVSPLPMSSLFAVTNLLGELLLWLVVWDAGGRGWKLVS